MPSSTTPDDDQGPSSQVVEFGEYRMVRGRRRRWQIQRLFTWTGEGDEWVPLTTGRLLYRDALALVQELDDWWSTASGEQRTRMRGHERGGDREDS